MKNEISGLQRNVTARPEQACEPFSLPFPLEKSLLSLVSTSSGMFPPDCPLI